ncbi:DUF2855 domain-containing protein [Caulobacter flavus]|uniref:DUF2855 domain-containing protein n=1 Tax=Caulobacter flavus TaxID=1679497 RepID=A0A2N5CZ16_9CAUL|nr:DUF2855 family protein [Caulobacter flavus]AYV45266.1 DUF2855 domain-containing protein [Caulobacter flavus]PLR19053.1 DUF2855 domain-containing protein [Caulobacter flavus]
MAWDFLVAKSDLRSTRFQDVDPPPLRDGEVRLAVESFALTANNVTYAAFGETMRYWDFFPGPDGWGRVPVWGHARVEASAHPEVAVGRRFYGFLPMSTHLTVQARPGRAGLSDAAPHRQGLAAAYNHYLAVDDDGGQDDYRALLQPLFITSFLIEDFLDEHDRFGAASVVLTSASAKTAIGLAWLLKARGTVKVVGLTSPRGRDFVEGLGCYDQVLAYGELPGASIARPAVSIDFAGDAGVLRAVHETFGQDLAYSMLVGGAHWEAGGGQGGLPGPRPVFFFAPDRIAKRRQDWGAGGFEQRYGAAWSGFVADAPRWLHVNRSQGPEAIAAAWLAQVDGRTRPDTGVTLAP